jgi:oligosaccharide repeat unit polymerase
MAALTFLTKSETQGENGLQVASDMTFEYMVGPIAAFDYAVYHPEQFREQPAAVFAEVLERLSTLRLIHYTPPDNVGVHVDVPFGTNVYTCFMPYYEDFGAAGCFLFFTLFGLVEGYVFYAAARGNNIAAFVLAYLSYSLMFSVFADSYHFVMGYLYLFAYIVVYFYFLKRIRISGSVIRIRISQPPATE